MFRKRQSSSSFPKVFRYVVILSLLFCFYTIFHLNSIPSHDDLHKKVDTDTLHTPFEPTTGFLKGHTYQELLQLESTWTPKSYYSVPVTILIAHTDIKNDVSNIYEQLDAIYSQTVKPESIWIITTKGQEGSVNKLLREKRLTGSVQVYIVDMDELGPFAYLKVAQRKVNSKYVMLLKSGVRLGNQYLQNMLHISNTKEYSNTILGTMGVIVNNRPNKSYKVGDVSLTCYEDHRSSYYNSDSMKFTRVSKRVDMLTNVWFLQRQWISTIFRESNKSDALGLPIEFLISFALRYHSNIPSTLLPTLNKESWGDIRRESIQTGTCNYLKKILPSNIAWKHYIEQGYPFITKGPSNQNRFMIIMDGPDQEKYFRTLYCKLSQIKMNSVSVVITGVNRELDPLGLRSIIKREKSSCGQVDIYDLDIQTSTFNNDVRNQAYRGLGQIIEYLKPEVLIYAGETKNPIINGISLAIEGFNQENFNIITEIKLPLEEVEYITGLIIDLPFSALRKWHEPKVQLQVITQNRPDSLSRLINSLNNSYYFGDNNVPLTINIDRGADPVTMEYCLKFQWNHGLKHVRHRVVQGGLLPAIIESYYPRDYDDYGILLEDDVELSPFYYLWAKYTILKYRYGPDRYNNQRLYGISFYGQRQNELNLAGRRPYNPETILNGKFHIRSPYLSQVPCSWGAVYFPEIWREFHEYLIERLEDDTKYHLQNLTVPKSRSYRWKKSWKKYLIELVYLRGYTMLYPNFKYFTSFSTNHAEYGIHLHNKTGKPDPVTIFGVPLMKEFTLFKELPDHHLADFAELPVTDLWGNLTTFDELIKRGTKLHNEVSICPPHFKGEHDKLNFSPRDILCVDEGLKRIAIKKYKKSEKQNMKVLMMYKILKDYSNEKVDPMRLLSDLIEPHINIKKAPTPSPTP